jgi:hypothetical protein
VKTHIIQLNPRDDYLSIRDKMDWSQARHILLVCPAHSQVLKRKLDLKVLRQHAIALGSQLAVVTDNAWEKFYAHQVGLPVFSNILEAQNSEWEAQQSGNYLVKMKSRYAYLDKLRQELIPSAPTWWDQPVVRVVCLCVSLLAFFSLVGFIIPGATITISPIVESQTMLFEIVTDPSTTMINYSNGSVPAYILETVVESEGVIHASGTVDFPDQTAKGNLTFSNTSDKNILIPVGTIVKTQGTNPIKFITTSNQETTVEPEQTVVLEAQAMSPGLSGNLAKNQLVVIEGPLASSISVTNPSATTGGTQEQVPAPNSNDQASLHKQLLSQLEQAALEKMQTQIGEGDWIISPTLELVQTVSEIYFPEVGEPANDLKLNMIVRFQIQVVSDQTLHLFVEPVMDAYTPNGTIEISNSLVLTQTDRPILMNGGNAQFKIKATRTIKAEIVKNQIIQDILGAPVNLAVERLSASLPLADKAQINLIPSWWPRLPWLGMRIEVIQPDTDEDFSY